MAWARGRRLRRRGRPTCAARSCGGSWRNSASRVCAAAARWPPSTTISPDLRFLLVAGDACPQELATRWARPGQAALHRLRPGRGGRHRDRAELRPSLPAQAWRARPRTVVIEPAAATTLGPRAGRGQLAPSRVARPPAAARLTRRHSRGRLAAPRPAAAATSAPISLASSGTGVPTRRDGPPAADDATAAPARAPLGGRAGDPAGTLRSSRLRSSAPPGERRPSPAPTPACPPRTAGAGRHPDGRPGRHLDGRPSGGGARGRVRRRVGRGAAGAGDGDRRGLLRRLRRRLAGDGPVLRAVAQAGRPAHGVDQGRIPALDDQRPAPRPSRAAGPCRAARPSRPPSPPPMPVSREQAALRALRTAAAAGRPDHRVRRRAERVQRLRLDRRGRDPARHLPPSGDRRGRRVPRARPPADRWPSGRSSGGRSPARSPSGASPTSGSGWSRR